MFKTIPGGRLPERATRYSAGFDVFANEDVVIGAGETKIVGLGIVIDFDLIAQNIAFERMNNLEDWMSCHYLELHPRSSLRAKGLGGGVGIIDMDYRDEIKIVITNLVKNTHLYELQRRFPLNTGTDFVINRGDKIGQILLKRHEGWLLPAEYTLDQERQGGFGSTGA